MQHLVKLIDNSTPRKETLYSNWKMRCTTMLLTFNLLQFVGTKYTDLSSLCIGMPEEYKHDQPYISFTVTPYPFVTKKSNLTLACAGHVDINDDDEYPFYLRTIVFEKNGVLLKPVRKSFKNREEMTSISRNYTVTGPINNGDKFVCTVFSYGIISCNKAQFTVEVKEAEVPNISSIPSTIKHDVQKLEISCNTTGVPLPEIHWLLNGSTLMPQKFKNKVNISVVTNRNEIFYGNDTYALSKIIIAGRKFPLRIQCAAKNEAGREFSENVYVIQVEVVRMKLKTARVHWADHPDVNSSFLVSGYNICLQHGNEACKSIQVFNTSVTFADLRMGTMYTVKIQALTTKGDLVYGTVAFYSPDVVPKPRGVLITTKAGNYTTIQWSLIEENEKHDKVTGYKVRLRNERHFSYNITTKNNKVVLQNLAPNTDYEVSIVGLSNQTKGIPTEWIKFNTSDIQTLTNDKKPCSKSKVIVPVVTSLVAASVVVSVFTFVLF